MNKSELNEQLINHLQGGEAFMPLDKMLEKITFEKLGERPGDLPYSFYELFYHLYYTQNDILEYCTSTEYVTPAWPKDYWPGVSTPENKREWEQLKEQYFADREALVSLLSGDEKDLLKPVRPGTDHTLFREVLLVIEHSAYHTGQLLILLRHLGLHSS